jgi:hypothetical protein
VHTIQERDSVTHRFSDQLRVRSPGDDPDAHERCEERGALEPHVGWKRVEAEEAVQVEQGLREPEEADQSERST